MGRFKNDAVSEWEFNNIKAKTIVFVLNLSRDFNIEEE